MDKKSKPLVYWTLLHHDGWNMHLAATFKGLCYVGSQNEPFKTMVDWVNIRFPDGRLVQRRDFMQPYVVQLKEYFKGERTTFTIPIDLHGTPFQLAVWNALREIPFGQTESYSDLAHRIQRPSSARAVGSAIGRNPVLMVIPCHRVLGKNGSLTGYRGGMDMKRKLLHLENKSRV